MAWSLFPTKRPTLSRTTLDLLLLLGLFVLFYGPVFLNPAFTAFGGDGLSLFVPALTHYTRSMYMGTLPLWNSYNWMGAPFLAAFQAGVLYPPNLLSLFFQNPETAQNFGIFLSLYWLACGAYFFGLRALELERSASLLMAIAMGCSGFVGGHAEHVNQLAAICWIPWIMGQSLLLLRYARFRNMVWLSLCLSMQTLAGHPQYMAYTLLYLTGLVAIYFVYYHHRRRSDEPPSWLGIALLAAGVCLAVGLSAAQILPSAELSALSVRQMDAPERMFSYSFPPRNLLTLVHPYAFGNPVTGLHALDGARLAGQGLADFNYSEWVCYSGLITVVLALLALATLFQEFVVRCFFFLALLSFLLAAGDHVPIQTPPYQLAMMLVPGGEHLRVPARFLIFFLLSLHVLAAVGFNQAQLYLKERLRIPNSTLAPLRLLLLVVIFADLFLFSNSQTFRYPGPQVALHESGPMLDFFEHSPGEYKVFRQLLEIPYDTDGKRIADNLARRDYYTRLQLQRFQPNLNLLRRIQVTNGYEEGLLPTLSWVNFLEKFRRNLHSPRPDTFLMGLMNVKYLVTDAYYAPDPLHLAPLERHRAVPLQQHQIRHPLRDAPLDFVSAPPEFWADPSGEDQPLFFALYENLNLCQKFVWESKLDKFFDLAALEVETRRIDPAIDIREPRVPFLGYRRFAQPAEDAASTWTLPTLAGRLANFNESRTAGSPNAFTLDKLAGDAGRLLMIEAAYPGWVCAWDGGKEPLQRVNAVMMGCSVPVGPTRLEFRFEPFSFRLGLFVSCCCATVLSSFVFFLNSPSRGFWRRWRHK